MKRENVDFLERERERERSKSPLVASFRKKVLSSSSKFINKKNFVLNHLNNNLNQFYNYLSSKFLILKKSFTLVELSIVLLVLALLVSTLLVGRQIIDRAKVQQIVSELDYYTKNFQMFRDQYDFLPGALDEGNCRKYPEFSMQPGTDKSKFPSQCDDPDAMIAMSTNKYYTSYKQANFSMVDMVHSGMIENRSTGERRRWIYSVATTTEKTCVTQRKVKGGYMIISMSDPKLRFGHIDATKKGLLYILHYGGDDMESRVGYGAAVCLLNENQVEISNSTEVCDTLPGSQDWGFRCKTGGYEGSRACGTYCNCVNANTSCKRVACDWRYMPSYGNGWQPLSTWGLSVYDNDNYMDTICNEKTVAGTKRIGYMLEAAEVYNQANRSSISDKVWITYSSGKVDKNLTYGVGENENKINAGDSNVIVYFLFDPSKPYVQADGAMSFDIFDLLNKKINGNNKTVGALMPLSISSGDGFNFAYAMR